MTNITKHRTNPKHSDTKIANHKHLASKQQIANIFELIVNTFNDNNKNILFINLRPAAIYFNFVLMISIILCFISILIVFNVTPLSPLLFASPPAEVVAGSVDASFAFHAILFDN